MAAVNPQGGNQPSQQPGQMMGGAPQQQPQFNQFGGYQVRLLEIIIFNLGIFLKAKTFKILFL